MMIKLEEKLKSIWEFWSFKFSAFKSSFNVISLNNLNIPKVRIVEIVA